MDRIIIDSFTCYAYHGVLPEENSLGQEFQVSIEMGIDLTSHNDDRIDKVPDYRKAVMAIEEVMYSNSCRLLETLACRIADKLLKLTGVLEATVEVRKPSPPLPGVQGGVGVIVNRHR
ncbi:MAG: dihydroneopterin aldolase [Bacillota bacterium]|nr:dihydroneopterin aldolase [Bacillota bacterium]